MEFDWDEGNRDKNLTHGVHDWEIEEALQDPRGKSAGKLEVGGELRYLLMGQSKTSGKYLRVVYTIRERDGKRLIRPISATSLTGRARRRYRK